MRLRRVPDISKKTALLHYRVARRFHPFGAARHEQGNAHVRSPRDHRLRLAPVPQRVRHRADARRVLRHRASDALHGGGDRACPGGGALRRHSGRGGGRDRPPLQRRGARFRSPAPRDRQRRLSDPAAGASAREAVRRGGALPPLGRHHPGHHGHRRGAPGARRLGDRCGGYRRAVRHPRGSRPHASRHADGRPHNISSRPCR